MAATLHLEYIKIGSICVVVQNFMLIGRCWDIAIFRFFQNGGRPPSSICYVHVWTTHNEYLVVFIAVQSLVE